MSALNDPALVAREYADDSGLAARIAAQQNATGPDPRQVAFDAIAEAEPQLVLEVGPGRGELAERIENASSDARVVAVDQSERMVELTAARGVEAIVGDVEDLPFRDGDLRRAPSPRGCSTTSPNVDQASRELRRVLPPGRAARRGHEQRPTACASSGA